MNSTLEKVYKYQNRMETYLFAITKSEKKGLICR